MTAAPSQVDDRASSVAALEGPRPPDPILATIPDDLRQLRGRPFGRDEQGNVIAHGSGSIVAGAVRYLQAIAGDRAEGEMPLGVDVQDRAQIVERARTEIVERLVALLNRAIPDDRYHVTPEYLVNESNNYSYEFRLFVAEYCRLLSGDEHFFFNQGRRTIPGSVVLLARPIGIRGTYAVLPRFTAKFVQTDLRVGRITPRTAVVEWHAASQLEHVPPDLHRRYVDYACQIYRGTFAAIPTLIAGLPMSEVRQVSCQLEGADHCEWEFSWQARTRSRSQFAIAASVAASLAMLAWLLLRLPAWDTMALVAATLLPASLILYGGDARRRSREIRAQQAALLEQRDLTEREYDRSERANAELQQMNLELERRIAELTTLNEVGVAASATLDLSELLDRCLRAVVAHLRFDRALVLLADEGRGVLGHGRSVGGTDEMERRIGPLELSLDDPHSQLVRLYRSDGPVLFEDVDQDPHGPNRSLAIALGVRSFLGTPLITKGRVVGVMAVDNRPSGRQVQAVDGPLLFTIGNLIASAIENARLYNEIESQNRELEARVEQRTDELRRASADAEEARAAAEAASETKSSFLANVSHELRTPLTSVVGFTRMVEKRLDEVVFPVVPAGDAKVEKAVRQVRQNLGIMASEGERLTSMINDVLDLAKIEAGKLEWRSEPVAMAEVIEQASRAAAPLVEQAGLRLQTDVRPGLPAVLGDRNRLVQVVLNLLSNAVKFTPSGTVTVRARATEAAVQIDVIDTGVGIGPEDQASVFEQFRQAGDTLTDKPRGTGLGLPICRQIVTHHGGRIWLESSPGSGSTFSFTLPVHAGAAVDGDPGPGADAGAVPAPVAAAEAPDAPQAEPANPATPLATVLLVEDDPATRELVRQAIEPCKARLLEAADGETGLALAREHWPALVILDVILPGMDGFEVAAALRRDPLTAGVPLLMLTISTERERAEALAVDRFIEKPIDPDRLAREVSALLPPAPSDLAETVPAAR